MGIPTKVSGLSVNALPFRAYCKIWNDWFRDENLKTNCHIYTDETTRTGENGTEEDYDYVTGAELGGSPLKVAKLHDYFTSALPQPQKGEPVKIPLGTTATVKASRNFTINIDDQTAPIHFGTSNGLKLTDNRISNLPNDISVYNVVTRGNETTIASQSNIGTGERIGSSQTAAFNGNIVPDNLYADLSDATAATISQLRTAFAIQKYYEQLGRTGSRYIEYLRGVFGVTSSDARLQRAEYLGGARIPLNIDQIIQTSSTDSTSPQGNTAGFSCTINSDSLFTKSFEEHGFLIGVHCVRTDRTYQQGLEKMWTRKKWTDYYNPFFANLSEMPIYNENIYVQGNNHDKEVFGYQEAWAEYRYQNNRVSGYMRSNATGSLDVWHFADDYDSLPHLGSDWIDEPVENVDRTIAVTSQLTHQFIGDFFFKCYYTRVMPVYSVPGLIDHV